MNNHGGSAKQCNVPASTSISAATSAGRLIKTRGLSKISPHLSYPCSSRGSKLIVPSAANGVYDPGLAPETFVEIDGSSRS